MILYLKDLPKNMVGFKAIGEMPLIGFQRKINQIN